MMSDEWKYKKLPRVDGEVPPIQWDKDKKDWDVYTGGDNTDVVAELESIKATQNEILERLDGTLDTRLTGSNVEDEDAIPTKLLSSNKSKNYMEGKSVPAGSRVSSGDIDFTGTRIGVGVRFESPTPFRVYVNAKGTGSSSAIGTEEIFRSEEGSTGIGSYMLKAQRYSLSIQNDNSEDEELRFVSITEFMSSGGANTNELD